VNERNERAKRGGGKKVTNRNRRKSCVCLRVVVVVVVVCEGCMNITIFISFDEMCDLVYCACVSYEYNRHAVVVWSWGQIERPRVAQRISRKSVLLSPLQLSPGLRDHQSIHCACICFTDCAVVLCLLDLTLRLSYMYRVGSAVPCRDCTCGLCLLLLERCDVYLYMYTSTCIQYIAHCALLTPNLGNEG
jgi:hypothetical protein